VRAEIAEGKTGDVFVTENEIGTAIVDAAIKVHTVLGPGLLESVYEAALAYELTKRGLKVERQKDIRVPYEDVDLGVGFRADMLVERKVLVELKSVQTVTPEFRKITTNYLKLGGWKLAYLINFNVPLLKQGIERLVNGLEDARRFQSPRSPRTLRAPQS
jgi:GxxExxY protein